MAEFPHNATEALALTWLSAQNLTNKTPEEVEVLYREALNQIAKKQKTAKLGTDNYYHYDD